MDTSRKKKLNHDKEATNDEKGELIENLGFGKSGRTKGTSSGELTEWE